MHHVRLAYVLLLSLPTIKRIIGKRKSLTDVIVFAFQIADHDRDMTLVTQILWGRTTHVS
jgi:hypothetical protein